MDSSGARIKIIKALAVFGYCSAAGLYFLKPRHITLPDFWMKQVAVLFMTTGILSLSLFWIKRTGAVFTILLVQFGILLLICYPEGGMIDVAVLLMVALSIDTVFALPKNVGLILSISMAAIFLIGKPSAAVWPENPGEFAFPNLFVFVFVSLVSTVFASFIRYSDILLNKKTAAIDYLEKTVNRLTTVNIEFQEYAASIGPESVATERKRISREIHDTIGYSLMNMIMMMEAASDLATGESEKLKSILAQTRDQAQRGLQETRRSLRTLRVMDKENIHGLKAIKRLATVFEKVTGVPVILEFGNLPFFISDEVNGFMYRMIQEGLTNAFKHGRATEITIQFWIDSRNVLYIRVHDNGLGFSGDLKEGIGIAGMKERIERLRGRLEAGNVYDGFQLNAWIPLEEAPL